MLASRQALARLGARRLSIALKPSGVEASHLSSTTTTTTRTLARLGGGEEFSWHSNHYPNLHGRTFATESSSFAEKGTKKESEETKETAAAEDDKAEKPSEDAKAKASSSDEQEEEPKKSSLRDTVNRIKGGGSSSNTSGDDTGFDTNELFRRAADGWASFRHEVSLAWQDLMKSGERQSINKKITPVATADGDKPYDGPVDILVIDPSEHLTAWERMQRRLQEAPVIQDILARTEEVYEKSGAKKFKARVDEVREDAQEAWETSQNPWVYRISSVYDTLTAETAESIAVRELRQLDPNFTLEDWRQDVVEHTLPRLMQWFLEGRINQLKDWFGEGVFKRIAAEITARQQEGVEIDTHVLGIMNSEILAVEPDEVNKGSPIIILHFMVQQINCVRKKKDGTIVEGSEDDIKANSYVAAFQREYHEELGELQWKIVDFRFNGAIAYL